MALDSDEPLLKTEVDDGDKAAKKKAADGKGETAARLDEIPHWRCGPQRLLLRHKLNTKEIDAAELMAKYDADGSKVLEIEELKKLLQDFNNGVKVKTEDLSFIMRVADKNHDDVISQEEVLVALRSWYAYQNMPSSVGTALTKHQMGKSGPMPSDEKLRELLLALNESQPVSEEEVAFVRASLHAVGGRPDKVTPEEMRKALATWYLNIQRPTTSDAQLIYHGFGRVNNQILKVKFFRRIHDGECDFSARGTKLFLAATISIFLFFPLLDILIARSTPIELSCEHPHLDALLKWSGYARIVQVVSCILAVIVQRCLPNNMTAVVTVWCIFGIFTVIVVAITLIGAEKFLSCTPYKCGFLFWHYGHFMFVMVPLNFLMFICCGVPCIYCYLGSNEFFKSKDLDDSLHKK